MLYDRVVLKKSGKPLSEMDVDTAKPLDYDFRSAGLLLPVLFYVI
jgi:hypothetical protein